MRIDIATIFPKFFETPLNESIMKRAQKEGVIEVRTYDIRDYTHDKHHSVDDKPFGGGPGMVMKPEPIFECIENILGVKIELPKKDSKKKKTLDEPWIVVLDPGGEPFNQKLAGDLAKKKHLILIAGHYEGIDHRVHEYLVDQEISIGDYITMGGEAPALCLMEAVVRLIPGVLGNDDSIKNESFELDCLEYPQYTRPREYRGLGVPEVLASGHHQEVEKWRLEKSKYHTEKRRPDLRRSKQEK